MCDCDKTNRLGVRVTCNMYVDTDDTEGSVAAVLADLLIGHERGYRSTLRSPFPYFLTYPHILSDAQTVVSFEWIV